MKLKVVLILFILLQSHLVNALGRLFMTPEQRFQLEHKNPNAPDKNNLPAVEKEIKQQQSVFLNGFIKPKHSASTIWVNGQVRTTKPQRNYFVRHWVSPTNQVSVDVKGGRAELSPGQTLDVVNNSVKEIYDATSLNDEDSKEQVDDKSELGEKQQSIKQHKKTSLVQQAIEINKITTDLPSE